MNVVFDLDGTLCNIEHRLHFIKDGKKDWPGFFRACVDDVPVLPIIQTAIALACDGNLIEIWSGRSDIVRDATETWLSNNDVPYGFLRMRKDGDYRADDVVKGEWMDKAKAEGRLPVIAFDDRQRVVDAWRAHGVICCQVAPGNF